MATIVAREQAGEEEEKGEEGGSSRDEFLVRLRESGSNAEHAGDAVALGARQLDDCRGQRLQINLQELFVVSRAY